MTILADLKDQLEKTTEQVESNTEPYQRGALILVLITLLLISIYLLTYQEKPEPRELTESERKRLEALAEERLLQKMTFLKKLKE